MTVQGAGQLARARDPGGARLLYMEDGGIVGRRGPLTP